MWVQTNQIHLEELHFIVFVKGGYLQLISYLVSLKVDIGRWSACGYTPFCFACYYGHLHVVKYMVSLGVNI